MMSAIKKIDNDSNNNKNLSIVFYGDVFVILHLAGFIVPFLFRRTVKRIIIERNRFEDFKIDQWNLRDLS